MQKLALAIVFSMLLILPAHADIDNFKSDGDVVFPSDRYDNRYYERQPMTQYLDEKYEPDIEVETEVEILRDPADDDDVDVYLRDKLIR